jgi:hypothetical protein
MKAAAAAMKAPAPTAMPAAAAMAAATMPLCVGCLQRHGKEPRRRHDRNRAGDP